MWGKLEDVRRVRMVKEEARDEFLGRWKEGKWREGEYGKWMDGQKKRQKKKVKWKWEKRKKGGSGETINDKAECGKEKEK